MQVSCYKCKYTGILFYAELYTCCRGGKSKVKKATKIKKRSSRKLDDTGYCLSRMSVIESDSGAISVRYIKTHTNHRLTYTIHDGAGSLGDTHRAIGCIMLLSSANFLLLFNTWFRTTLANHPTTSPFFSIPRSCW